VCISDIGPQPADRSHPGSTLVCVTTNVNTACGKVTDFARIGHTHQVKLTREVLNSTPPLGRYTCAVPDPSTHIIYSASIILQKGQLISTETC